MFFKKIVGLIKNEISERKTYRAAVIKLEEETKAYIEQLVNIEMAKIENSKKAPALIQITSPTPAAAQAVFITQILNFSADTLEHVTFLLREHVFNTKSTVDTLSLCQDVSSHATKWVLIAVCRISANNSNLEFTTP